MVSQSWVPGFKSQALPNLIFKTFKLYFFFQNGTSCNGSFNGIPDSPQHNGISKKLVNGNESPEFFSITPEYNPHIPLYDPKILERLDWSNVTHMKGGVTSHNPGKGFKVRPLCKSDYDKGK